MNTVKSALLNGRRKLKKRLDILQGKNKILEKTGFTVDGILKLVQSPEYLTAFRHGIKHDHPFADIHLGGTQRLHHMIKTHLEEEIKNLEKANLLASKAEQSEIDENIATAKSRLSELTALGPYEFYNAIIVDPNYWIKLSMLPYHSKGFVNDEAALEQEQYEKYLNTILKLKSAGAI